MANAIDKSVFENLKVMTGADFIGELIDTFLSDSPQQITIMQSALKTGDSGVFDVFIKSRQPALAQAVCRPSS
jgi:hypothetical protein